MKELIWFSDLVYTINIVDETQIADRFVANEWIDVSLFQLWHQYVCECRDAYFSHSTAFEKN